MFLRDVPADNIWCVDSWDLALRTCEQTGVPGRKVKIEQMPPSPLPSATFDTAFAYSVFSHLSPKAHLAWQEEFARVVKPGALVFITTQARWFLDNCRDFREHPEKQVGGWHVGLANSFVDYDAEAAAYDRGEILYAPNGGGPDLLTPSTTASRRAPRVLRGALGQTVRGARVHRRPLPVRAGDLHHEEAMRSMDEVEPSEPRESVETTAMLAPPHERRGCVGARGPSERSTVRTAARRVGLRHGRRPDGRERRPQPHRQLVGEGKRVLELGCATGSTTKVLQEQGCRVVGHRDRRRRGADRRAVRRASDRRRPRPARCRTRRSATTRSTSSSPPTCWSICAIRSAC